MDSTALAPRGLASGTVAKVAGMVRICLIGLIGSQGLASTLVRLQFTDSMVVDGFDADPFKIESVPLERVLREEAV